jgi:isoquinoline 1-oxidoreductase subunit alpha
MTALSINGKTHDVNVDPDTPLLWVLRETIGLTGTKYGCGIAQCGACTVHVDGAPTRSCSIPMREAVGKQITTIEGLAQNGVLHQVQRAWIAHDVPQCGYCQSGMIMAVAALLKEKPKPTDADIDRRDCRSTSRGRRFHGRAGAPP